MSVVTSSEIGNEIQKNRVDYSKVRKTVIYDVIDAAPFWADGAAEGGIGCWENV